MNYGFCILLILYNKSALTLTLVVRKLQNLGLKLKVSVMFKIAKIKPNIWCREKGEGLINIQNKGRWNYSNLASRQIFICCVSMS